MVLNKQSLLIRKTVDMSKQTKNVLKNINDNKIIMA